VPRTLIRAPARQKLRAASAQEIRHCDKQLTIWRRKGLFVTPLRGGGAEIFGSRRARRGCAGGRTAAADSPHGFSALEFRGATPRGARDAVRVIRATLPHRILFDVLAGDFKKCIDDLTPVFVEPHANGRPAAPHHSSMGTGQLCPGVGDGLRE
jgi:hypothetical protein